MNRFQRVLGILVTVVGTAAILSGCATTTPEPGEIFPCAADSNINKSISPEAELTDFSCVLDKWEGSDTLHFNVSIKNISDQPQRYKVNIFLDNGKAVGGLIPRKTKKGLVEPGQTSSFVYPVSGMDKGPESIDLIVKTMEQ
jgi:hypothetical protein